MRLSIASIVSCLAALAMAATPPDYSQSPSGNAILKPGLNEQVPAGKPYTIEWDPTTKGPVSLILLRGPSKNVKPIDTLADSIPNSGSFSWTPSTSLEPDTTHYGLMLVVEGTGQYQYSTQFGISNPDYTGPSSNSSSTATTTGTQTSTTTVTSKASTTETTTTTATSSASASTTATTTETAPTTLVTATSASGVPTSTVVVTVPNSTGAGSSVASGSASSSSTPTPSTTLSNGGDRKAISLGAVVVGAFAVMAF